MPVAIQCSPAAAKLLRRGLCLEYITLGWNVAGAAVALVAAYNARSVALAGFGLDSVVEIGASTVVVWELTGNGQHRRKRAIRMIGVAFISLAVFILIQSILAIFHHSRPDSSPLGIVWLIATCITMTVLAISKGRVGKLLDNPVLLTESRVTLVDAYLAASVLAGLIVNALFAIWWADAAAALVIVAYGLIEGCHAWEEGGK